MPAKHTISSESYARRRAKAGDTRQADYASARDIPLASVQLRGGIRRNRTAGHLPAWLVAYFPHHYPDGLYPDQRDRLTALQHAIQAGEDLAVAAFRGGGKTTEFRDTTIWAALNGVANPNHVVLVAATAPDAAAHMEAIKSELETNDALAKDYPEACVPIRSLDGSAARCNSQTVGGERTRMRWEQTRIILPEYDPKRVPRCRSSGAIIQLRSADGSLRGLNCRGVRPGVVFLDDVETDESARSALQTEKLRSKIDLSIGGLGSHRGKLTRVMLCTMQERRGCVAGEFTDRALRPSWHGLRQRYLLTLPTDWVEHPRDGLWHTYIETYRDGVFGGPVAARAFYVANRATMDAGALASWPHGYRTQDYESAVEKFFALMAEKRENGLAYCALELQNDAAMLEASKATFLQPQDVAARCNGLRRRQVPDECHYLAAFVDVGGLNSTLHYAILATAQGFRLPRLVDWQTMPAEGTIGERWPGLSPEAAITAALTELDRELTAYPWRRDCGTAVRLLGGIDSGSGFAPIVYAFCRAHPHWVPAKGSQPKLKDFDRQGLKDAKRGPGWREMPSAEERKGVSCYLVDTPRWKRFVRNRLIVDRREPEGLTFAVAEPRHALRLARHLLAENPVTMVEKSTGDEWEEWQPVPGEANHWLDCVVGACVVASMQGVRAAAEEEQQQPDATRAPVRVAYTPR
jgi:hypothetical protein